MCPSHFRCFGCKRGYTFMEIRANLKERGEEHRIKLGSRFHFQFLETFLKGNCLPVGSHGGERVKGIGNGEYPGDHWDFFVPGSIRIAAAIKTLMVCQCNIDDVNTDSLDVRISGSGKVMAQGKADEQQIKITGSGSYAAPDLVSDDVEVAVSGSGDALVWANDTLHVDISGAGKVAFQGEPQVDSSISGAGVVQQIARR